MSKIYPTKTVDGRLKVQGHEGNWLDVLDYQNSLNTYPGSMQRCMSSDGRPGVCMQSYIEPECGCKMVGCGTLQFPMQIEFCDKHAAL